jgi:hypothetical protein
MSGAVLQGALFGAVRDLVALYPGVEAYYENGPVPDLERVSDVWLDVELRWYGASTVSMGERPRGRATGALMVRVYRREGTGTQLSGAIVDALEERFRPQRIGGAVLDFPERLAPTELNGWPKVGILAPFYFDRA